MKKSGLRGFTIIELLVVIAIIGIITGIILLAYSGTTRRAGESSVLSDVRQGASVMGGKRDSTGVYSTSCIGAGVKTSPGNTLSCTVADDLKSYCLSVTRGTFRYFATQTVLSPISGRCSGTIGIPTGEEDTAVDVGIGHACAVRGGEAYCWGSNYSGQLGIGTDILSSAEPVAVSTAGVLSGKTVTDISTGWENTCAIASGKAYCWGSNDDGRLGNGSTTYSNVPVAVTDTGVLSGKTIDDIQVGTGAVCALATGQLYCWGWNGSPTWSNFGNGGTPQFSTTPVAVSNTGILAGKTITKFALDGYGGPNCVIADGALYCWGYGSTGGLGHGANPYSTGTPVTVNATGVLAGKTITDISTYEYQSCAVASGKAYCWGGNGNGQLGIGTNVDTNVPVAVSTAGVLAGKTVTQVAAGDYHSCALADGKVYCWGDNMYGQLGNNTVPTDSFLPVAVDMTGVMAGKTVTQLISGYNTICAVADDYTHCWGNNDYGPGVLGDGTDASYSAVPVLTIQ